MTKQDRPTALPTPRGFASTLKILLDEAEAEMAEADESRVGRIGARKVTDARRLVSWLKERASR